MTTIRYFLLSLLAVAIAPGSAHAQPAEIPPPAEPAPPLEEAPPADPPGDSLIADTLDPEEPSEPAEGEWDSDAAVDDSVEEPNALGKATLTVHVITTRDTYAQIEFDIYDASIQTVVASGLSADEGAGGTPPTFELHPGLYKIVPVGEPFTTKADFATVSVTGPTEFLIVVDADSQSYRSSGIVTSELPLGRQIAGLLVSLNLGGTINFNQQRNVAGTTNGDAAEVGIFGNFSLVYDHGDHFLKADSRLHVNVLDPRYADAFSTTDHFEGSVLYALNLNNDYVGPYARAGFRTKVFPGYLYLEDDMATGVVNVNRLDGTTDTYQFGGEANVDDLRIEVAEPFAPLVLQQEIGANLKALKVDLRHLKATIATSLGFGFREGLTEGLLVVDGDEDGNVVNLNEVDDYWTAGPALGASGTVTLARYLFATADLGLMAPVRDIDRAGDNFGERLLLDFSGTGGLKLPALSFFYASLDYTVRLQRDGYLTSETQFAHSIMARANVRIF